MCAITFPLLQILGESTRAVKDCQDLDCFACSINDSIGWLDEFAKIVSGAFRYVSSQLWKLFKMINRRKNSFDGQLRVVRRIPGEEIEYRLKVVGCLGWSNELLSL